MTAMKPAITRVDTRNGIDGTAIVSRASISSEIRMAPSCAVKPQPTVADRARPATRGRDLTGVDVGRQEAGQRLGPDLVECGVTLEADDDAGEARHQDHHADGSADDRESARTEGDLGEQAQDLTGVVHQRLRHPRERAAVE